MSTTLTVRTGEELRATLEQRAKGLGKSVSELVREILEDALADRPFGQRTSHVKGRLELPDGIDPWRRQLKERNWRG